MARQRKDTHRVGAIEPEEYTHLHSFSFAGASEPPFGMEELRRLQSVFKLATIERESGGCYVCGAHYRHGDVFLHVPTQEIILTGQDCGNALGVAVDRREWSAIRRQRDAARRQANKQRLRRRQRWAAYRTLLAAHPGINRALKVDHRITRDLRAGLIARGYLSPKQVALAFKLEDDVRNPKPSAPKVDALEGRHTVRATIVSTREEDSGYGIQTKALYVIQDADRGGEWRAWGTVPSGMVNARNEDGCLYELRGATVELRATFKPKPTDRTFAFITRPSGSIVEATPLRREDPNFGAGRW